MKYYRVATRLNKTFKDYVVLANDENHARSIARGNGKIVAPCTIYQVDNYPRKNGLITFMPENKQAQA